MARMWRSRIAIVRYFEALNGRATAYAWFARWCNDGNRKRSVARSFARSHARIVYPLVRGHLFKFLPFLTPVESTPRNSPIATRGINPTLISTVIMNIPQSVLARTGNYLRLGRRPTRDLSRCLHAAHRNKKVEGVCTPVRFRFRFIFFL